MAANYWTSSQFNHWRFTRPQLDKIRASTEADTGFRQQDLGDPRHLRIFFHSLIQALGRHLSVRQQALATAEVYLARFYTRSAVQETNPYLILATCVYLACKMEECPQHIRSVVSEAKSLWPDFITHDPTKLAECEFYLIEELDSYLIIHHPYRSLAQLSKALGASGNNAGLSPDEMQTAWSVVNDSYVTDLPLLYPPNVIAMTAMYMSVVLRMPSAAATQNERTRVRLKKIVDWFAGCGIDLEDVVDCTQEMISLYEVWESYNEKTIRDLMARLVNKR
ncbi:RNA polymerase II holoenzyme cyclin-like subunit [Myxozyma melibiosi]|uniref:RNA polymerase II holoenzyme cyclin-like subunit n=1 Tax=Myxozyma melibiosi TaxID=54550 RepID=A0ABR1F268_9ASCO